MNMKEIRYGIEIETIKRTREDVANAIQSVVGGTVQRPTSYTTSWAVCDLQGRTWKVVSDASLTSVPEHLRAEVVSPVLCYDDLPQLQEVVRAIRRAGAKVDSHCGIHIHVDAAPFDGRTLGNLAKMVYKQEPLILHALGISPERLARYTRPVSEDLIRNIERHRPRTKDELNPLWYGRHNANPIHYDSTRYYGDLTAAATATTFSASKITALLDTLKAELLGGADAAYDTLKELQDALLSDQTGLAALLTAVDKRVRFDAVQTLTAEEQAQARQNIGALAATAIGDPETDFVAAFETALI